jgi:hypothetical protein
MQIVRLFVIVLSAMLLTGCPAAPQRPMPATQSIAGPPFTVPPPEPLHALALRDGAGRVTVTRESRQVGNGIITDHKVDGVLSVQDDFGQWRFTYTRLDIAGSPLALVLAFANRSPRSVSIDWNRSVLVDPAGRARRLIHRGVRLADRGGASVPTTVPAGASIDDFLYPADAITFTSGRYGGWSAPPFFELLRPGQSVSLVLMLQTGDASTERRFTFLVERPIA